LESVAEAYTCGEVVVASCRQLPSDGYFGAATLATEHLNDVAATGKLFALQESIADVYALKVHCVLACHVAGTCNMLV
jgi:hypothetical protein